MTILVSGAIVGVCYWTFQMGRVILIRTARKLTEGER